MFKSKRIITTCLSALAVMIVTHSAYADGPFYNCQSSSDPSNFSVSVKNGMCVWAVKTGVVTPVGGYQPTVARFDAVTFQVSNPSVANCSPKSFNASEMNFDGVTLSCKYIPVGATNRPQEVDYNNFFSPFEVQQYKNNQWKSVGSTCPVASQYCRVAPSANQ